MTYFLTRGRERKSYQVRRHRAGDGYELVVIEEDERQLAERFRDLPGLLTREYQLLQAWQAAGWREVPGPQPENEDSKPPQQRDLRPYYHRRQFNRRG